MIREIEGLLKGNPDWREHLNLYHHVKSAIYYSEGLKGTFGDGVLYNIEVLVNSLYELERNEEHPLYPFIASWNSRFVSLAGPGFENVMRFRRLILKELKKWMCPENASKGDYYRGLVRIQNDLNYPTAKNGARTEQGCFVSFRPALSKTWRPTGTIRRSIQCPTAGQPTPTSDSGNLTCWTGIAPLAA